ncbi:MAG: amidohydrolase [Candidatus Latescibacteria bacterium]|nr:amidohydrolase [Candidatus Latescibacterota bacterium]
MHIIDTHAHIYSNDEVAYPKIENPLRPPEGTGTIEHLRQETAASGVTHVVAIQTSSAYRWDNRFLADSARANTGWMVGVCTLNPDDPTSPEQLTRLVEGYNVRGLRSVPSADPSHLDHPGVEALWSAAARLNIVVNVLTGASLADELARMLERFPHLTVVLDHCLGINPSPDGQATLRTVVDLAQYSNLHAKLTFVPTGSAEPYPCRDMHDAVRQVIRAYGPGRCVWGTDFPCELWCPKVTYTQHLTIFTDELSLSEAEQRTILETTSTRLWFQEQ